MNGKQMETQRALDGAPQLAGGAMVLRETSRAIEPANMDQLERLATSAAKTGFFGAKSPEQALLVMMAGRDLGLSYSQSLRAFHVIEGKPTLSADGMVATCLVRRDVCEYFRTISVDDKAATVETKRVGQEAQRYTFTLADAQRAGVAGKQNWAKYPSRMLLARARSALARDVYPDLLLGLYDPDEIEPAPQRVQSEARAVPEERPSQPKAVEGELLEMTPEETAAQKQYDVEFSRIGREGGVDELRAVMRAVTRAVKSPTKLYKDWCLAQHEMTKAAIEARAKEPPTDTNMVRESGVD